MLTKGNCFAEFEIKSMYESVRIISVPFFLNQKSTSQSVPCDF